ncbi:hypothetical protein JCM19046_1560 [Bacillus sp. JCM 19046]|nr:hypothetical protein JCM19045_141 [Bacillus sp. JCM 19045]GAF17081.1 hypothetical protein JCM19046_1560 [Bacillus sp. JCM 19046]
MQIGISTSTCIGFPKMIEMNTLRSKQEIVNFYMGNNCSKQIDKHVMAILLEANLVYEQATSFLANIIGCKSIEFITITWHFL